MSTTVQLLLVCLAVQAHGLLHHQQPTQAGYQGARLGGYAAAGTPYRGYDAYASSPQPTAFGCNSVYYEAVIDLQARATVPQIAPPQPYSFGYDNVDEYGNRQFRSEQGDSNNVKTGSYGYRDVNGLYRRVNYVADANGFRVTVDTNEPGTAPGASADAVFNAAPVVPPVPSGSVQGVAPAGYAAGVATPYNAGGYSGYGRYGYNPYSGAAGASGYAPYGPIGYATGGPALGGQAYGGSAPYGYGAAGFGGGYVPGAYGSPVGYGGLPSAHHGYRRRR